MFVQSVGNEMHKIKDFLNKKHIFWHSQNLNDKHGLNGSMFWNGRAWLHAKEWVYGVEWHFKNKDHAGIRISLDDEEVNFSYSFPPFGIYHTLNIPFKYNSKLGKLLLGKDYRKTAYLQVHDWGIWTALWIDDHSWSNKKSWLEQRQWNINLLDALLGRWKYTERNLEERDVVVPMPEGNYSATVKVFESTWKRPKWFPRKMIRTTVNIPNGIPHPGKGENSWDCGMDATYGLTSQAKTVEEAIGECVKIILNNRRRYGGKNWKLKEIPKHCQTKR